MKLDFEKAVDQFLRWFRTPGAHRCPQVSHAFYFRIWPPIFFKDLIQNSTPKLKVEIQFYVDSENFIKNIETLLSSIIFNKVNCLNIAN